MSGDSATAPDITSEYRLIYVDAGRVAGYSIKTFELGAALERLGDLNAETDSASPVPGADAAGIVPAGQFGAFFKGPVSTD